jgi:putative endonuclease
MSTPSGKTNTAHDAFHSSVWWLYVLECQGGVLYTGIAKDVDARFESHLNGTGAMFTRLNRPVRVLSKAPLATRGDALRAEYALKQLSRDDKLRWCACGLSAFIESTIKP